MSMPVNTISFVAYKQTALDPLLQLLHGCRNHSLKSWILTSSVQLLIVFTFSQHFQLTPYVHPAYTT